MSLSSKTISAIQKAGAAVFTADAALKDAVNEYAALVNSAMASNPFHLSNDTLFRNWQTAARLSQTLASMEEELRKVHQAATEMGADDAVPAVLALAAPGLTDGRDTAVDVVIKHVRKVPAVKVSSTKERQSVGTSPKPHIEGGNPAKLLSHLQTVLGGDDFQAISQTAMAKVVGIPMGSMTAAIKALVGRGQLLTGPGGSLKLVPPAQQAAA